MEVSDKLPLQLTSSAVHPHPDGNYPFHLIGFLIPHEMLRRELTRIELALQYGLKDTYHHPWKVLALKEWMFDFFLPLLSTHHYIEDNIIFPFYLSLNVIVPERHSEDHLALLSRMNRVKMAIEGLMSLVQGDEQHKKGTHKDGSSASVDSSTHSKQSIDSTQAEHEAERLNKLLKIVKKQEQLVKEEMTNLADNMRSHFSEEEAFWPALLEQCGEGNWAKVEQLIINYTLQFGEGNAGDPYRMMICAISHSMGIRIPYYPAHHSKSLLDRVFGRPLDCTLPGCRQEANQTRWASLGIQRGYILTRPYLVRNWKIIEWNNRYMNYVHLIESITASGGSRQPMFLSLPMDNQAASSVDPVKLALDVEEEEDTIHPPPDHIKRNARNGKFVNRLSKTPVYLVLFFILSAFYSLIVGPYFAALSNPLRNIPRLKMYVVDFDEGYVGDLLLAFTKKYQASHEYIPTLEIIPYQSATATDVGVNTKYNPQMIEDHILDQDVWGAIYTSFNATNKLLDVYQHSCIDANNQVVTRDELPTLIYFAWDEGRNSGVAAPNIGAFTRTFLQEFESYLAANFMKRLHEDALTNGGIDHVDECMANGAYEVLTHPLKYKEDNLTPVSVSPVANSAGITVGSIYVAVFGANFIVGAVYSNTGALAEDLSPYGKVMLRTGTFMLLTMGLAVCYGTLVVGLTADGSSGYVFSGTVWAQICASQWLHMMIWSFGHAWEVEALGFVLMPFFAAFFLLCSITGGWNTDLADPGYKAFFQIFPFNWSINIMRYVVFKSCRTKVVSSACVLCAYWLTVFVGYIRYALNNELLKVSDKSLMKSKYTNNSNHVVVKGTGGGDLLLRDNRRQRQLRTMIRDFSKRFSPTKADAMMPPYTRVDSVEVEEPHPVQGDDDAALEEEEVEYTLSTRPISVDEV